MVVGYPSIQAIFHSHLSVTTLHEHEDVSAGDGTTVFIAEDDAQRPPVRHRIVKRDGKPLLAGATQLGETEM